MQSAKVETTENEINQMKIIKLKKNIKMPQSIIALGFFDGVHQGHRKVIKTAVCQSRIFNIPSLVFTFKDSPKKSVLKDHKLILSFEDKAEMIKSLGADYLVWADFDDEFAQFCPENFVKDILIDKFHARLVVVGFNYRFGHKAKGNSALLSRLGRKYGFKAEVIPPLKKSEKIVSSTLIKKLITEGQVSKANKLLDYKFFITGKVVKGRGIGRSHLNILTANINWPEDIVKLPTGVYAVRVEHKNKVYEGVANLGFNPTVNKHGAVLPCAPALEAHIFDFKKDIYGEKISVFFARKIREEKKFADIKDLKKQIQKDIEKSKNILAKDYKRV